MQTYVVGAKQTFRLSNKFNSYCIDTTYATMAAGTGIDPKTLQSIMGHADIQTTMNRYAHRRMDKIEEAKESLKTMYM